MSRRPLNEAPAPVEVNATRVVVAGTAGWLVALVVLALAYPWLADTGREQWLAVAGAGVGLGGVGYLVCSRRDRRVARDAARRPADP